MEFSGLEKNNNQVLASSCSLHPNKCLIWHLCAKLRFFHYFSKKKEEGNRDIKQSFHKMKNVQLEYYFCFRLTSGS